MDPLPARRRQPRTHWLVLAVVLVIMGAALTLNGYAQHSLGASGTTQSDPRVLAELSSAGPVLDLAGPDVRSAAGTDRTVALTFDDGPDPRWTPQVLAVLARHHVPATFFVVGSRVLAHPGLVRAERKAGDEIGSHTFVHANVGAISGWQGNLELSLTQSALAATLGIHTGIFRPPYSSGTDSVTGSDFRAWRAIARQGYLIVLANRSTDDWARPGVPAILAHAEPAKGTGTIVMFHDGGGDRQETVDALDQYISTLQGQGYRFTTVSDLAGLPTGLVNRPVSLSQRVLGEAVASLLRVGSLMASSFAFVLGVIALLGLARAFALFYFARRHAAERREQELDPHFAPPVSVVVPAYNEEVGIENSVRSLAASDYPVLEIIVVDDGSTDRTSEVVAGLGLDNVRLVRQVNGGKAAALNTGIRLARHEIIVTVDGDTVFEPETIRWLVQPFARPHVGAVSGNTKVGNRRRLLGRWQHIEYVLGFNLDRRMFEVLGCMPTVPGAIGAFRKAVLDEIGGVSTATLAEDTDVTMSILRAGWHVAYEQRATAWTEAPSSIGSLWKQRYRWSYGTMQAMWKHRGAFAERGPLGRRALPYIFLFQVLLPLLAPAVDLFALFGILFERPGPMIAYWLVFNAVGLGLGVFAFHLDDEPMGPLWALPLQQFVYRQIMYLVVIQAFATAVSGTALRWHKLERTGEMESAAGH